MQATAENGSTSYKRKRDKESSSSTRKANRPSLRRRHTRFRIAQALQSLKQTCTNIVYKEFVKEGRPKQSQFFVALVLERPKGVLSEGVQNKMKLLIK